jgi:DNA-binding HxlR family transcriptional regulator
VCWTTARAGSAKEYGLVYRFVYPAVPLHVEYSLTELGHSAAVPLRMLRSWVENNVDGPAPSAASCAGDTTASAVNAYPGRP